MFTENSTTNSEDKPTKQISGKYRKLFKEFSQESSAGGINKVFSSKPIFIRSIWALLCIVCYGAMIFLSYLAVKTYFDKPTSTFIDVSFETDMPFPAITICNLNKFREKKLKNLPRVKDIIDKHRNSKHPKPGDWGSSDELKKFFLDKMRERSGIKNGDTLKMDSVSSTDILESAVLDASATYSMEALKETGHQFEDFIVNCRWMGINCEEGFFKTYWRHVWNWKYGNCYTFNFDVTEENRVTLRTTKAGPKYGLALDLFIEQHEYVKELSQEAGVKVVIADSRKYPFPFEEGIAVSPGKATAIALRKELIERVDRFNNNSCFEASETDFDSIYNDNATLAYSIQSCLDTCLVEQQINECNCSEAKYTKDGNVCTGRLQSQCIVKVETKYKRDTYGCIKRCPQACKSVSYRTTISEAESSSQYLEQQRIDLNKTPKFRHSQSVKSKDNFQQNFLRIKIYFEELNLVRIHQEFSYPISSLLSDIGGQLGLWVGLSVITFAEVGDLFLSFILLVFSKD